MNHSPRIGIIGLGLIGGSLAKAWKANDKKVFIVACDTSQTALEAALAEQVVDVVTTEPGAAFSDCDVVFLCTPVLHMNHIVENLLPYLSEEAVMVDVGSTKTEVMYLFEKMDLKDRFIGGHPMAGSERSGYMASRANLFENAWFVLTPYSETTSDSIECVSRLVIMSGAMPVLMDAQEHDRAAAHISHMPHAIASLLVETVAEADRQTGVMQQLAAGGFKDITRIASASPSLWTGICRTNKQSLSEALLSFRDRLDQFLEMLKEDQAEELTAFFERGRHWRDNLGDAHSQRIPGGAELTCDVEDRPGIIAKVAMVLAEKEINIKNMGINHVREEDEGALLIRFEAMEERDGAANALRKAGYRVKCRT